MKKLVLLLVAGVLAFSAHAQLDPKKVEKNAKQKSPLKRADAQLKNAEWDAALQSIEEAAKDPKEGSKVETFLTRAAIYDSLIFNTQDAAKQNDYIQKATENYNKVKEMDGAKKFVGRFNNPIQLASGDTLTPMVLISRRFLNQGVGFYNDNNYPKAAELFEKASISNPTDTLSASYALTLVLQEDNVDNAKVEKISNRLLKAGYNKPLPYQGLLKVAKDKEDWDTALKVCKEARKYNPTERSFLLEEINVYIKTNKTQEAISNLEKAASEDPTNALLPLNLGILYEQVENADKALESYKKAYAIDKNNYDAVYSLGAFYFNKGVKIGKEAANLDYKEYQKRGKEIEDKASLEFKAAIPYFEEASKLDQKNIDLLNALKAAYSKTGDTKKAAEMQVKIDAMGGND